MSSIDIHTCITCRVAFKNGDIQREHYKSDWHRYNLKRKVANLPSVTAEEFNNRVLQQKNKNEESQQNHGQYCDVCRKNFSSENSYINHLNSKRHKDALLANISKDDVTDVKEPKEKLKEVMGVVEVEDIDEVDSDEWDEDTVSTTECLFCAHHSRSITRNIRHMTSVHSFFIPDVEYCVDLPGLLTYLGEKVYEGYMCLWCNEKGRTFYSAEAAQGHMIDKGHCKMLHEGVALAEYADFYDYSSSYPDNSEEDMEEEVDLPEIDGSDYQLVLPSGAVVGHRSLVRYYKQRFGAATSGAMVSVSKGPDRKLHKVLAHYRQMGWTVAQQETVARRARDVHYMRRMQSKWQTKLSFKANKLQTHFRQQVNY